jgi:hypothetical protein
MRYFLGLLPVRVSSLFLVLRWDPVIDQLYQSSSPGLYVGILLLIDCINLCFSSCCHTQVVSFQLLSMLSLPNDYLLLLTGWG